MIPYLSYLIDIARGILLFLDDTYLYSISSILLDFYLYLEYRYISSLSNIFYYLNDIKKMKL